LYELFSHNARCKHVHQAMCFRACKHVSSARWTFPGWKYFKTLWEKGFYKPLIVHEIVGSIFSQWQNMFFMYSKFHFYHGMSSFKFFYTFWFPPMVKGKYIKFLGQDSFNYRDITKDLSLSKVQRILNSDQAYTISKFFLNALWSCNFNWWRLFMP